MAEQNIRKVYLDEGEDFSELQSYGRRVITPVLLWLRPLGLGRPPVPGPQ